MLKEDCCFFNRGSIAYDNICLRKCVVNGSSTQVNDFEEKNSEINSVCWVGIKYSNCSTSMFYFHSVGILCACDHVTKHGNFNLMGDKEDTTI